MEGHEKGRGRSTDVRVRRVKPQGGRAAERYRKKEKQKLAVMAAVTLFLLFLTGRAVWDLVEIQRVPDAATAGNSLAEKVGKVWEAPDGTGIEPLSEDRKNDWLVAIDPGHGGVDSGTSADGVHEQEINLKVALFLADRLEEMGIETVLLREDNDTYLSLEERVEMAEKAGAHIYVSIHQNFYEGSDKTVSGLETWYCDTLEDSARLARMIHQGAVEETDAVDRGVKETNDIYVIYNVSMPSCLVEAGFLSNREERQRLQTEAYQRNLAEGIAEGIGSYFDAREQETDGNTDL